MHTYNMLLRHSHAQLLTSGLILDYNNWGSNPRLRPGYDLFWVADPWITNNLGSQK